MKKRVPKTFFTVPTTLQLAKRLLGCTFVQETPQGTIAGIITETEAYTEDDAASHSFCGKKTARNSAMFESGGHLYVYLTYGIHHCVNIVSEKEGIGCAVLIRAVEPQEGVDLLRRNRAGRNDHMLTNGPGKLCQAFGITLQHDGIDLTDAQSSIYITERTTVPSGITAMPRIGISKAKGKLWRFLLH